MDENTNNNLTQPVAPQLAPKKKTKGLLIGIIIVVLLLAGGLVGGYLWYQNPDKVIADVTQKASSAKIIKTKIKLGELDLPSPSDDVNVSFDGLELEIAGDMDKVAMSYNLSANLTLMGQKVPVKAKMMLVDKQDIYFYLEDVSKTVDGIIDGISESLGTEIATELDKIKQQLKPIVTKVENQWVKVSLDELKELPGDDDSKQTLTCVTNAIKNFSADKYIEQTKSVLEKYKFYQVGDIKTVDSDFAINIKVDEAKLESYGEKLVETDFIKTLTECFESQDDLDDQDEVVEDENKPSLKKVDIVVSKWGHELKKANIDLEAKIDKDGEVTTQAIKLEATFDWPETVDIKAPSGAIKIDDWIKSIEDEAKKLKNVFGGSDDDFLGIDPFSSI